MAQTLVQAVLEHEQTQPDKLAVCFRNESLTYAELADKVRRAAKVLQTHNVQKWKQGTADSGFQAEYIVGMLAIQYLGAVSAPLEKTEKV